MIPRLFALANLGFAFCRFGQIHVSRFLASAKSWFYVFPLSPNPCFAFSRSRSILVLRFPVLANPDFTSSRSSLIPCFAFAGLTFCQSCVFFLWPILVLHFASFGQILVLCFPAFAQFRIFLVFPFWQEPKWAWLARLSFVGPAFSCFAKSLFCVFPLSPNPCFTFSCSRKTVFYVFTLCPISHFALSRFCLVMVLLFPTFAKSRFYIFSHSPNLGFTSSLVFPFWRSAKMGVACMVKFWRSYVFSILHFPALLQSMFHTFPPHSQNPVSSRITLHGQTTLPKPVMANWRSQFA